MAKRKTILGIPKCGQPTSCAPYAPLGCSVSEYPLWAVMLAHTIEKSMKGPLGIPVHAPKEGPHGFIPLFFTREQAVAWAGGDEHVAELTTNTKGEAR